MPWKKLLAWATGQVDEALRQKLEFVLEENRVYRALLDRHSPRFRLFPPNLLRSHAYWLRISISALRPQKTRSPSRRNRIGIDLHSRTGIKPAFQLQKPLLFLFGNNSLDWTRKEA